MKPHKHAEVIKAWADNPTITIQYRDGGPWRNIESKHICWDAECEYRIKPAFPETTMTHEQLEHAYNAAPVRWELKMTAFANAVLAHAVETGQLVVPGETVEGPKFGLVPATDTKYGIISTRELAISAAMKGAAVALAEKYSSGLAHHLSYNLDPAKVIMSMP